MKLRYLSCALLLAWCMPGFGQTSTSSSSGQMQSGTSNQSGMNDTGMKKDKSSDMRSGKSVTMTGCVEQVNGKWALADKKHPEGVMLMTNQDLSAHNGHKVKVKGTWADSTMASTGMSDNSSMGGSQGSMNSGSGQGSMSGSSGSTGNQSSSLGSSSSSSMNSGQSSSSMGSGQSVMNMKGINVTDIKMESDQCDATKMK